MIIAEANRRNQKGRTQSCGGLIAVTVIPGYRFFSRVLTLVEAYGHGRAFGPQKPMLCRCCLPVVVRLGRQVGLVN